MEIYHGNTVVVKNLEIKVEKFNKDFFSDSTVLFKNKKLSVGQKDLAVVLLMYMNIEEMIH